MPSLDIEALLNPVSETLPCGEDLGLGPTASFQELERAVAGMPERFDGKDVIPAKDPDWMEVRRLARELLAQSKDLRIAVWLTLAETALDGVAGLASSVSFIRAMVDKFWDTLHPQLEADGEFIPDFRVFALGPLSDAQGLIRVLRNTYLVEARQTGRFTFRDVESAEKGSPSSAGPSMALLLGALTEAGADYARDKHTLLRQVFDDLRAIETVFMEKISNAPNLVPLKPLVQSALNYVAKGLPAEETAGDGATESAGGTAQTVMGAIRSREDVKKLLDQICEFLQKTEPSNPAPILLSRARRLLDKGFLDIIQELIPDSLGEIEKLAGGAQKTVESTEGQ